MSNHIVLCAFDGGTSVRTPTLAGFHLAPAYFHVKLGENTPEMFDASGLEDW